MRILVVLSVVLLLCTVVLSAPVITKESDCDALGNAVLNANTIWLCKDNLKASRDACTYIDPRDMQECKNQKNKKPSSPNAGFATAPGMVWGMTIFVAMGVNAMM